MKKILLVCAMLCALAFFSACDKESNGCNCNNSDTPEENLSQEELLLGSWVVISNHYVYNGEIDGSKENTLVDENWKFCNEDGNDWGKLYRGANNYCNYFVNGDKLFFDKNIYDHWISGGGNYVIGSINTTKLVITREWSDSEGGNNGSERIEFNRL